MLLILYCVFVFYLKRTTTHSMDLTNLSIAEMEDVDACLLAKDQQVKQRMADMYKDRGQFPPLAKFNSTPFHVQIHFGFIGITDVDEESSEIAFLSTLMLKYHIPSLSWENEENCVLRDVVFSNDLLIGMNVWEPSFLFPYVTDETKLSSPELILEHDGSVAHNVLGASLRRVSCDLNLDYYPLDVQQCEFSMYTSRYMELFTTLAVCEKISSRKSHAAWNTLGCVAEVQAVGSYKKITYTLVIERSPPYFVFSVLLPVIMLSILSPVVFAIPANSPAKIGAGMSLLLAFMVNLTATFNSMPAGRMTYVMQFTLFNMMLNVGTVCVGGFIQWLSKTRLEAANKLNNWTLVISLVAVSVPIIFLFGVFLSAPQPVCHPPPDPCTGARHECAGSCVWENLTFSALRPLRK